MEKGVVSKKEKKEEIARAPVVLSFPVALQFHLGGIFFAFLGATLHGLEGPRSRGGRRGWITAQ